MNDEDWDELMELAKRQYELALAGERPVFCLLCRRPYRARQDKDKRVLPFRHSMPGRRALCHGSYLQGGLTP